MQRSPLDSVAFIINGEKHALDAEQLAKLNAWLADLALKIDKKHRKEGRGNIAEHFKRNGKVYAGVMGGNLTFSVTPLSVATVFKVVEEITEEKLDLTNYENW